VSRNENEAHRTKYEIGNIHGSQNKHSNPQKIQLLCVHAEIGSMQLHIHIYIYTTYEQTPRVAMNCMNLFACGVNLILCLTLCHMPLINACVPQTRSLTCTVPCQCNPTTSSNIGVITDGPLNYANNMNCIYNFASNVIVNLQFENFVTEANNDVVTILICTTPQCVSSISLLKASGSTSLAAVYRTTTTHRFLQVRFVTNAAIVGTGWSARWHISGSIPCVCPASSYLSNGACNVCPPNSFTPLAGSTTIAACICNAGSNGPNGGPCVQCLAGSYKSVTGNIACERCPPNSLSPVGSTAITACVCNTGWNGANGATCVQCQAGTYLSGTACLDCPANSISPVSSTAIADCVCKAGSSGRNGGPCVPCQSNTYKSDTGNSLCLECPANSFSVAIGATNIFACACNAGSIRANGGPCVLCLAVTFNALTGKSNCETCPPHSSAVAVAGTTSNVFVCNAGSRGPNGGPCLLCSVGTYNALAGKTECMACRENSFSYAVGSTTSNECVCDGGWTGPNGVQ